MQINDEAQVFVHDLDLFVTVQFHDETPAVLLLHQLCPERGYSYEWKTAKLHNWPKKGRQLLVQWTTQYFSLYQDCHHIPAAHCVQHRDQRITLIVPANLGTFLDPVTTRSDKHACGKPTPTDRGWKQFVLYIPITGLIEKRSRTSLWKQSCFKFIFTFSVLSEVTNKPPGDWGRNPWKSTTKVKRGMTRRMRTIRWQIFRSG